MRKTLWVGVAVQLFYLAALTGAGSLAVAAQVADDFAPPPQLFEGILSIMWGDLHPEVGGQGAIFFSLTQSDGTVLDL